jgi:hypothetical protein
VAKKKTTRPGLCPVVIAPCGPQLGKPSSIRRRASLRAFHVQNSALFPKMFVVINEEFFQLLHELLAQVSDVFDPESAAFVAATFQVGPLVAV